MPTHPGNLPQSDIHTTRSVATAGEIIVHVGARLLTRHAVQSGLIVIGRDPSCQIAIDDPTVSARHALLTCHPQRLVIEDLGSETGTFVDGQRLDAVVEIRPGQDIRVGSATLHVALIDLDKTVETLARENGVPDGRLSPAPVPLKTRCDYAMSGTHAVGGMGAVMRAKDLNLGRDVAMKVMLGHHQTSPDQVLRFVDEARVTGLLEHPNIVPVHELGVDEQGQVFYTMKFVKGITLKSVLEDIKDGNPEAIAQYPLVHLLTIFQKVCDAVAFAHSEGVLHRDLKPANIMVGDFGEVLVLDWGLAKVLTVAKPRDNAGQTCVDSSGATSLLGECYDTQRTLAGSIMGTPQFMSPEQAQGRIEWIDQHTDIYALGAILYNILTLEPPIKGSSAKEAIANVLGGAIEQPQSYNRPRAVPVASGQSQQEGQPDICPTFLAHCPDGRVPDSLAAVAMKALAPVRTDRYPSVKELQQDIEAYQTGFATTAENAGVLKQFVLLIKRHKTLSAAALFVLLLATAFIIQVTVERNRALVSEQKALAALADLRQTAPQIVEAARMASERGSWDKALSNLDTALALNPDLNNARLLRAEVLIAKKDYAAAREELTEYLRQQPADLDAQELAAICDKALKSGNESLDIATAFVNVFFRRHEFALAESHVRSVDQRLELYNQQLKRAWPTQNLRVVLDRDGKLLFDAGDHVIADLAPLRGIPLHRFKSWKCTFSDLGPLEGMPLETLNVAGSRVRDLTPIRNLRLKYLELGGTSVTDLSPLRGMPLEELAVWATAVSDLSPLVGMRLRNLNIGTTPIADLTPVAGMPLEELQMNDAPITDLTPLTGIPLKVLTFTPGRVNKGMEIIRQMKSLTHIGSRIDRRMPADQFWREYDAGRIK